MRSSFGSAIGLLARRRLADIASVEHVRGGRGEDEPWQREVTSRSDSVLTPGSGTDDLASSADGREVRRLAADDPHYPGSCGAGPQATDPPGGDEMQVRLLRFGSIEVEGQEYENDIFIESGRVRKRKKKPSKPYRDEYGHTPLSVDEALPWGGGRLIIGTGAYGSLPIMPEVLEEARRRGVDLTAIPTEDACRLIESLDRSEVHAVLHVTC
jgi:hypothetical protein